MAKFKEEQAKKQEERKKQEAAASAIWKLEEGAAGHQRATKLQSPSKQELAANSSMRSLY